MRWRSVALLLPILGCTSIRPQSETIVPVPVADGVVSIRQVGPFSSDDLRYRVELRTDHDEKRITYPLLVGPVLVSNANAQIFSCEATGPVEGVGPAAYDLHGRLSFERPHVGFLRGCGMTDDERLYWLHYNLVRSARPINRIIVLDESGSVVFDAESSEAGEVEFESGELRYVLPIPGPEFPG
jgi:hypothetical protein